MGHVGLTPQAISVLGGFRAQGRTANRARELLDEALRLQDAGGKNKVELSTDGRVWTSDRRIQMDGGLKNALLMRIKKHVLRK